MGGVRGVGGGVGLAGSFYLVAGCRRAPSAALQLGACGQASGGRAQGISFGSATAAGHQGFFDL